MIRKSFNFNQNNDKVREKADLEWEIKNQIQCVRLASNSGDLITFNNTVNTLISLVRPWANKEGMETRITEIDGMRYVPKSISDFYTEEDKEFIEIYGRLKKRRVGELTLSCDAQNRIEYKNCVQRQFDLIMEVIKILGLGLEEQGNEFIFSPKNPPKGELAELGKKKVR